ncbi:MAG TPA: type II CAAX endopeptidase family protein [Chloroflexia bacterium]|nr:type II CAAX endopeptidase family protein [Chloroflexia bacterium]
MALILRLVIAVLLGGGFLATLWATAGLVRRRTHRVQLLLAIVAWIAGFFILTVAATILVGEATLLAMSMLEQELLQVTSLVAALVALWRIWGVPRLDAVGLGWPAGDRRRAWRDAGFGLLLGPLAVGVMLIAGLLGGWDRIVGVAPLPGLLANLGSGVVLFLLVAVFEELSMRGCLFALVARVAGLPAGVVVSVVLFALLHLANPGAGATAILGVGLAGAVFVLAFVRSGALWLPIAFHLSWDWAETSLYGFPDSGIPPTAALQLAIDGHAPEWATGGTFGPEASACVILALGLAAGAIWLYTRRRAGRIGLFPAGTPERSAPGAIAREIA